MSDPSIPIVDVPDETDALGGATTSSANWEKLDALLADLPPGIPVLAPEDAGKFDKYTHRPRHVYTAGDGWKNCVRVLKKYDADLCKAFREEIDTLLVFAGLFSAVVTAFTIESYQWLQTNADDTIVLMLSQIALSVSLNSTTPQLAPPPQGLPDSVSLRINAYWFLALALSLSAALVAILCKQWIREFERNTATIEATERMAWLYCSWSHSDLTSYGTRLERLRQLPGVLELAELLNSYVQMRMPTDLPAVFTTGRFSPSLPTMERLIGKLLEIARHDTGPGDAVSVTRDSPPRWRTPSASLIAVHPLADTRSGGLTGSESEEAPPMSPPTRRIGSHGSMSPAQPHPTIATHVHYLEGTEAENSVSRGPGPHDSLIQDSAVIQDASDRSGRAKRRPGVDSTEDALSVDGNGNG